MKNLLKTALFSTLLTIFSCSGDYTDNNNLATDENTQLSYSSINASEEVFNTKLKTFSINLEKNEIEKVRNLSKVKTEGEWTPGPENNSKLNLEKHFIKHGSDFKPAFKSSADYLSAAIKAANSTSSYSNYYFDTKYYKDDKIVSLIKWNSKTNEFTVTRDNGQIATYYLDNKINSSRYVLYPKN